MSRSWAAALMALAWATTEADAHTFLRIAADRGADPDTCAAALAEWRELQAASVQIIRSHA